MYHLSSLVIWTAYSLTFCNDCNDCDLLSYDFDSFLSSDLVIYSTEQVQNDDTDDACGHCTLGTEGASIRGPGMESAELFCPDGFLEAGVSPYVCSHHSDILDRSEDELKLIR